MPVFWGTRDDQRGCAVVPDQSVLIGWARRLLRSPTGATTSSVGELVTPLNHINNQSRLNQTLWCALLGALKVLGGRARRPNET